jgi:hypothetical protein
MEELRFLQPMKVLVRLFRFILFLQHIFFYNYFSVHADSSVMKTAATATTQTFGGR